MQITEILEIKFLNWQKPSILKNKKAIIKVYEYPEGEVNQVTDVELFDK